MGMPYEIEPVAVTTADDEAEVLAIDAPSRTYVHKMIVTQTEGGSDDFEVELYSNADAAAGGDVTNSAGDDIPPANYLVAPKMLGAAGSMHYFADRASGGSGFPFFNQDPPDTHQRFNKRKIYLRISVPGGSGAKKFAVSIGLSNWES